MNSDSETSDLDLTDLPMPGFDELEVGAAVSVDEGDNFGCEEYSGVVEAITERGEFKIRLADGRVRTAQRHMVDPA
jgi:hypothetical protein